MIRGLDTLRSSVENLQKQQETISGNIANVATTGYQEKQLFLTTLKQVQLHNYQGGAAVNQRYNIGGFTFGNELAGGRLNRERGALTQTQRATDFATNEGYFTIRQANGTLAYTRDGNFRLNEAGNYVTQAGAEVLNSNGNAMTAADGLNFRITQFGADATMVSAGNGAYTSNQAGQQVTGADIRQGYLEKSNVSVPDQMVEMIQTSRDFEANQKMLTTTNETLNQAVNDLGKV